MQRSCLRRSGFIIFFIILICIPVYAQVTTTPVHEQIGKYTVGPYVPPLNSSEQNLTYSGGATDTLTFWDLPLWIQVTCISELLIALFASIKLSPIILGKLSTLHKNNRAKRVEKYVAEHPGCTMTQISAETDIQRDTVKYYVYQFISMGKLALERAGRYSLLYKKSIKYDVFEKTVISYLHDDMNRKILWVIIENPGIMSADLSKKFGLSKSTVSWYVTRLLKNDLITYRKQGNFKKYFINSNVEGILRKYYS
jgi:predicted transcriptional regulator